VLALPATLTAAAIATAYEILKSLGHRPAITGAGRLLAGTVTSLTLSHV
jgi:maleate isomerase